VRALVAEGSREAWALVLGALADRDGQVADTAQLALPDIRDPRVLRDVLGEAGLGHKDPWVRVRAAEALGRWTVTLDGAPLARALDRRDPEVTSLLLWSLERLAAANLLGGDRAFLTRAVADELRPGRDAGPRAAALVCLGALDSTAAAQAARELHQDRAGEVRSAALAVAERLGLAECDAWLAAGLEDTVATVRAHALEVAAMRPTRANLERVVARLAAAPESSARGRRDAGGEPRLALRDRALAILRAATGWRHGPDPRAWRAALARAPAGWLAEAARSTGPNGAPKGASETARTADEGRSTAALGRLDPASDRLAILIDFSGSLWNVRADGRTRKELLDPEFRQLLASLERDAQRDSRFNVVPYTATPFPWQESIVRADARHVREAQEAYGRWSMRGQGDAYGALQVALADPEVDRVLLLTDGAPTGGRHWDVPLMTELLLHQTRHRPVAFDVVLVDAPNGLARRWTRLAEASRGRLVRVSFTALMPDSPPR